MARSSSSVITSSCLRVLVSNLPSCFRRKVAVTSVSLELLLVARMQSVVVRTCQASMSAPWQNASWWFPAAEMAATHESVRRELVGKKLVKGDEKQTARKKEVGQ